MQYTAKYFSPLGEITLAADEEHLTGLWFVGQRHCADNLRGKNEDAEAPVLRETAEWLDIYFGGREPEFLPSLRFSGTDFQREVWEILLSVPYGRTITYGEIAMITAKRRGLERMSAQAVGGAVGRNPIGIIVPCHRVVGRHGELTGYAGGIDKKIELLRLEGSYNSLRPRG